MAITKEQIMAAADQLVAAGKKPTLEAVRQITGGSYTTISSALNEWKEKRAATAAPLREHVPQAVADRMAAVGAEIWAKAIDLANARLATERVAHAEALAKARAEMEAERDEAIELADKLSAGIERLRAELAEARERAARLAGQLEVLQRQHGAA